MDKIHSGEEKNTLKTARKRKNPVRKYKRTGTVTGSNLQNGVCSMVRNFIVTVFVMIICCMKLVAGTGAVTNIFYFSLYARWLWYSDSMFQLFNGISNTILSSQKTQYFLCKCAKMCPVSTIDESKKIINICLRSALQFLVMNYLFKLIVYVWSWS